MANTKRFTVGTVVALDFQDGCGFTVGTIVGESYKYSHSDGQEHTFFQVKPAPGQELDDTFQVSLDEVIRYGVALPPTVLGPDVHGWDDEGPDPDGFGQEPAEVAYGPSDFGF